MIYTLPEGMGRHGRNTGLERFRRMDDGVICCRKTPFHHVAVLKKDGQLQLFFVNPQRMDRDLKISGAMSRIDIDEPFTLASVYTRVMMLAFAWRRKPARICILGLGGGRLPMVIRHHMPDVGIDCVEIDPEIVTIAEQYFAFRPDKRVRVTVQDAREYIETLPDSVAYDIVMIDCFTGGGHHPGTLSTMEFYESLKRHLTEDGVVASNLHRSDMFFDAKIATFHEAFPQTFLFSNDDADVVFGSRGPSFTDSVLSDRIAALDAECGLPFLLGGFSPFVHAVISKGHDGNTVLTDSLIREHS